jgi:hypothetical protein
MPVRAEVKNGFWVGIGFALAFLVWSFLQMLFHRAEGH